MGTASSASMTAGAQPLRDPASRTATRRSRDPRRLRNDEEGSTLLLAIFFGALSLAVVLLVVAATSLYLERKRLFSLADGAALAAAESFPLDTVSRDDSGEVRPALRSAGVEEAVREYLADASTGSFRDLRLLSAATPDGRSAAVSLVCAWTPPVVSMFAPEGVRIEVSATARSVLGVGG
ncbi:pilus assembly protein TadG-related protein [Microbacteriaceae bacterium 4G12]